MAEEIPTTELYFESHITTDPVFGDALTTFRQVAQKTSFRVADLVLMKPGLDEKHVGDIFMSTRSTDYTDIHDRTLKCVALLQQCGFNVRRYKIENTLIDKRL